MTEFDKDPDELAETYENRNESLQAVIDTLAGYEESKFSEHGFKTEVADEVGIDVQRVYYVLNNWMNLVRFRRHANRNPLDEGVAEGAYDDPMMEAMAKNNEVVADGVGGIKLEYEFQLDEVFRCIKLLPTDLGMRFFSQTIQHKDQIPPEVLGRLFEEQE